MVGALLVLKQPISMSFEEQNIVFEGIGIKTLTETIIYKIHAYKMRQQLGYLDIRYHFLYASY